MNTLGVPSGTGTSVALYSAEQSSGRGDSWGGIVESPGALAVNTQLAQARTISAYLVLVIPQIGEIPIATTQCLRYRPCYLSPKCSSFVKRPECSPAHRNCRKSLEFCTMRQPIRHFGARLLNDLQDARVRRQLP